MILMHICMQEDTRRNVIREASFQDIVKHLSVEMKGQFENNVFHADEIRIVKVA